MWHDRSEAKLQGAAVGGEGCIEFVGRVAGLAASLPSETETNNRDPRGAAIGGDALA